MDRNDPNPDNPIYTIGHSNHEWPRFRELLQQHGIETLVDVRTAPVSKYCPQFDKSCLENALPNAGIRYVFMGAELGGRPNGPEFFDSEGYALYDRIADTAFFKKGVASLLEQRAGSRCAIMCSEEDPAICHRHLLVGRVLLEKGVPVVHIRGDGTLADGALDDQVAKETENQLLLFDDPEPPAWKSTRSVLPKKAPKSSSEY